MLKVFYRGNGGRDRSAIFNALRSVSDFVPERLMRTLWYRLVTGPSSSVRWGKRIKLDGDGSLEFGPSLQIGNGVFFTLLESCRAELGNEVYINHNAMILQQGEALFKLGFSSYIGPCTMIDATGGVEIGEKR